MKDNYYTQNIDDTNEKDLLESLDKDELVGIVSEQEGGIIGYLLYYHDTEVINVLNKRDVYQKAYYKLMEYWDSLPDEDKPKLDEELRELGL